MAYHYVINPIGGEKRRIVTTSLATYQSAGWAIFDTEEERDTFAGPDWFLVCYAIHNGRPERIPGLRARAYYTEMRMREGWAMFLTESEARAALAAMPMLFAFNPETGKLHRVKNWLPEEMRDTPAGYYGAFDSLDAAKVAYPAPFCAWNMEEGYSEPCYPAQRGDYQRRGFIVDVSDDACRARLPVRYRWQSLSGRYARQYSGSLMRSPSRYRHLRAALRALNSGDRVYEFASSRGASYTRDTLTKVYEMVLAMAMHKAGAEHHDAVRVRVTRTFVQRVNKIVPGGLRVCGECMTQFASPVFSTVFEGDCYCQNCAELFCQCAECNVQMRRDSAQSDGRSHYCATHWTLAARGVTGELMEYSADVTRYKPSFLKAPGEKSRELWLGWELEVHARNEDGSAHECCDDCNSVDEEEEDSEAECSDSECHCHMRGGFVAAVRRVQETAGEWAIVKSDGSLNNGMEIVSVPASLSWHALNVKPWLDGAKEYLSGWPHNDCGIHVHVGRKQLSSLTQGKLLSFMHDPANQAFISAVAGRDTNTYCVRGEGKKTIPYYRREHDLGRYQALNFATRGQKTLEFRIFRSNVSPAGFMKNLEFVHALCSWARLASMQDVCDRQAGIKLARTTKAAENFVAWVNLRERDAYPQLVRWFETSGFLPKPRIHPDLNLAAVSIAA